MPCFFKLFMNGVMYHASTGVNHEKRDSTVCCFQTADGETHFGRITLFVNSSRTSPLALVREFHQPSQSILQQAGPPCRAKLAVYKEYDLLSSFITVVDESCTAPIRAIPITFIQSKVVVVKNQVYTYAVKQPNQFDNFYIIFLLWSPITECQTSPHYQFHQLFSIWHNKDGVLVQIMCKYYFLI